MYPKAVEEADGKSNAVRMSEKQIEQNLAEGTKFISCGFGEPDSIIVTTAGEYQTVIPEITTGEADGKHFTVRASMVAVSIDKGVHWTIMDPTEESIEDLRRHYPNLSAKLHLVPMEV